MLVSEATHSLLQSGPLPAHPDQEVQKQLHGSLLSECHLTPIPESWFIFEGEGLGDSMKEDAVVFSALEVCVVCACMDVCVVCVCVRTRVRVCVCVCVCFVLCMYVCVCVCCMWCGWVHCIIVLVYYCVCKLHCPVRVHRKVQQALSSILSVTPSVPSSPTSALPPTSLTPNTWPLMQTHEGTWNCSSECVPT